MWSTRLDFCAVPNAEDKEQTLAASKDKKHKESWVQMKPKKTAKKERNDRS